jgi:hypothetical protein
MIKLAPQLLSSREGGNQKGEKESQI